MDLALRGLETTHSQVRTLASVVKEQSQKIAKLEKEMCKINEQSKQIEKLEEDVSKVEEHSQEIERLKKDISQVKAHTQQVEKLEKLAENYAPFVWTIPNFENVYEKAVRGEQEIVLSEPFYLFKNGYKFRMKMMPDGGNTLDPVAHKEFKGRFCLSISKLFLENMTRYYRGHSRKKYELRPPHTCRFFVGRQKLFTCRLVCGEFRHVCDKIGAFRAKSDSARSQNVLSGLLG